MIHKRTSQEELWIIEEVEKRFNLELKDKIANILIGNNWGEISPNYFKINYILSFIVGAIISYRVKEHQTN